MELKVKISLNDMHQIEKLDVFGFIQELKLFLVPYGLYAPDFFNRICKMEWEASG